MLVQDYIQAQGLPCTTLCLGVFLENFFKFSLFVKQPDGTVVWPSNQRIDDKLPWHARDATGTAVKGELSHHYTLTSSSTGVVRAQSWVACQIIAVCCITAQSWACCTLHAKACTC